MLCLSHASEVAPRCDLHFSIQFAPVFHLGIPMGVLRGFFWIPLGIPMRSHACRFGRPCISYKSLAESVRMAWDPGGICLTSIIIPVDQPTYKLHRNTSQSYWTPSWNLCNTSWNPRQNALEYNEIPCKPMGIALDPYEILFSVLWNRTVSRDSPTHLKFPPTSVGTHEVSMDILNCAIEAPFLYLLIPVSSTLF